MSDFSLREHTNDTKIWSRFIEGDDNAYKLIYEKYVENLLHFGLQFSKDRGLIEDCVHDMFVQLYGDRKKLGEVQNVKTFLFVAFRNRLFNTFKKKNRSVYVPEFGDLDEKTPLEPESPESLLIDAEKEENQKTTVKNLLSRLSPRQQEAIYYRYYESMPIDEISSLMEMNYQSVQNLLQRSIKKIKESF